MRNEFVRVVELQSLADGHRFDCTVTQEADGKFAYDEGAQIVGQFVIFESDGLAAQFVGLRDRRVVA